MSSHLSTRWKKNRKVLAGRSQWKTKTVKNRKIKKLSWPKQSLWPYLSISQWSRTNRGNRIVFLKKGASSWRHMNHSALPCGLPFTPGPSLPSSPSVLKSFEAPHMWADIAYFSSCHNSFCVSQVPNRHQIEDYRVMLNSNTLEKRKWPQPLVSCLILICLEFVCNRMSKGGFAGSHPAANQAQHFALWISRRLTSWLLA